MLLARNCRAFVLPYLTRNREGGALVLECGNESGASWRSLFPF